MNEAKNAVRNCRKEAFRDLQKRASAKAQRSMLSHLADLCRWSCELRAFLGRTAPQKSCSHSHCAWMCYETEADTAETLMTDESSVRRTRAALVDEGWITAEKTSTGRGNVWFFRINMQKILDNERQKPETKWVKLPPFFDRLAQEPVHVVPQTAAKKVGTVPTFQAEEGRHGEHLSGQKVGTVPEKVGTVPEKGRHGAQNSACYKEERIEHKERKQQAPSVQLDSMDPAMIAKLVQLELRITDPDVFLAMSEQARLELADGKLDGDIVEAMTDSYNDLLQAKAAGRIDYAWGPERFFSNGHWRKQETWPWRNGFGPKPKDVRKTFLRDPIAEQIERERNELAIADAEREAERARTAAGTVKRTEVASAA